MQARIAFKARQWLRAPAMVEAFSMAGTPEAVADRATAVLEHADSLVLGTPLGPDTEREPPAPRDILHDIMVRVPTEVPLIHGQPRCNSHTMNERFIVRGRNLGLLGRLRLLPLGSLTAWLRRPAPLSVDAAESNEQKQNALDQKRLGPKQRSDNHKPRQQKYRSTRARQDPALRSARFLATN